MLVFIISLQNFFSWMSSLPPLLEQKLVFWHWKKNWQISQKRLQLLNYSVAIWVDLLKKPSVLPLQLNGALYISN